MHKGRGGALTGVRVLTGDTDLSSGFEDVAVRVGFDGVVSSVEVDMSVDVWEVVVVVVVLVRGGRAGFQVNKRQNVKK